MDPLRSEPSSTDGRVARGERARTAVVDALFDLIEAGELAPTAPRIAERAGVSLRLVFHHFSDLEDLFAACAARQMLRVGPTLRFVAAEGPFGDRLRAFTDERARLLELIAPVRRAALLREHASPAVAARLAEVRAWKRAEAARVFAIELALLPPGERPSAAAALGAACSFATWDSLRTHQGLDLGEARAAMARMIGALLDGVALSKSKPKRKPKTRRIHVPAPAFEGRSARRHAR